MIQEIPRRGRVVITVPTSPAKKNVTPRAVLSVDVDVSRRPVSKLTDLPACNPTRAEPMTPMMSNTTNAILNVEARERIRVAASPGVFIADAL
jgi:hypothetical protein